MPISKTVPGMFSVTIPALLITKLQHTKRLKNSPFVCVSAEDVIMNEVDSLEFAIYQIMMALGTIADFSDWYACGDELI